MKNLLLTIAATALLLRLHLRRGGECKYFGRDAW